MERGGGVVVSALQRCAVSLSTVVTMSMEYSCAVCVAVFCVLCWLCRCIVSMSVLCVLCVVLRVNGMLTAITGVSAGSPAESVVRMLISVDAARRLGRCSELHARRRVAARASAPSRLLYCEPDCSITTAPLRLLHYDCSITTAPLPTTTAPPRTITAPSTATPASSAATHSYSIPRDRPSML